MLHGLGEVERDAAGTEVDSGQLWHGLLGEGQRRGEGLQGGVEVLDVVFGPGAGGKVDAAFDRNQLGVGLGWESAWTAVA